MSLIATLALAASGLTLPHCSWDRPGVNPFMGDVVLAVDGAKVSTLEGFYKKLWDRASPDASIELTVLQGADIKKMVLKAVDRMSTMSKPSGI